MKARKPTAIRALLPRKIDDGSSSDPENGFIVVTQVGSQTFGIVVDGVFHTEEIVVKPLGKQLKGINSFAGATIMGDGTVALILDVPTLIKLGQGNI